MKSMMKKMILALSILGLVAIVAPRPASAHVSLFFGLPGVSLFAGPPVVRSAGVRAAGRLRASAGGTIYGYGRPFPAYYGRPYYYGRGYPYRGYYRHGWR